MRPDTGPTHHKQETAAQATYRKLEERGSVGVDEVLSVSEPNHKKELQYLSDLCYLICD